jgi:nucleophosmin 1
MIMRYMGGAVGHCYQEQPVTDPMDVDSDDEEEDGLVRSPEDLRDSDEEEEEEEEEEDYQYEEGDDGDDLGPEDGEEEYGEEEDDDAGCYRDGYL